MTQTEWITLLSNVANAVTGLTALVADHQKKIAALEAKVEAHDAKLQTAPDPGPKGT